MLCRQNYLYRHHHPHLLYLARDHLLHYMHKHHHPPYNTHRLLLMLQKPTPRIHLFLDPHYRPCLLRRGLQQCQHLRHLRHHIPLLEGHVSHQHPQHYLGLMFLLHPLPH